MTDEAGCSALDETVQTNRFYDYQWNTDGCYCSINWKIDYVLETCTERGEVINPFYKPGSATSTCITQADFEMNIAFSNCGDSGDGDGDGGSGDGDGDGDGGSGDGGTGLPAQPCEGSTRGFASAFLYTSGDQ